MDANELEQQLDRIFGLLESGEPTGFEDPYFESTSDTLLRESTDPVICTVCKFKNDFGSPNQADGTYVCFECTNRWY